MRIAEALQGYLAANSARGVGRELGIAGTTVGARGCDLNAWPLSDALTIAEADEGVGQAIVSAIRREAPAALPGQPLSLAHDLLDELASAGVVSTRIASAMSDQRIDRAERGRIRDAIMQNRAREDQVLADLLAADEAGTP